MIVFKFKLPLLIVVSTVSTVAGGEVPSCGVAAAAEAAEAVGEVIYISVAID